MSSPAARLAILVATGVLAACTTGSWRPARNVSDGNRGAASNVLGPAELSRVTQGTTVLAALEHLRPWFLHARGSVPTASLDGSPPAELSMLRMISVSQVVEVRFLRATSNVGQRAVMPNGNIVSGDVILVLTRKLRE